MTVTSPRQADILDLARRMGRVDVDSLSDRFRVSAQTIRKDLNELCDIGVLNRIHGGAIHPSGVTNFAYDSRQVLAAHEKQRIGVHAAGLIPNNSSVVINIGTTTEQVALALRGHEGIMVITNNLNVAHNLREHEAIQVIVAGGLVRQADGGIVGEATVDFIRQFKVDYAVIGASAIDEDGAVLDYDYREVRVSQEIIRHARKTILVADTLKFERTAPVKIVDIADIDVFVTDQTPPQSVVERCTSHGTQIEIAPDIPEIPLRLRDVTQ